MHLFAPSAPAALIVAPGYAGTSYDIFTEAGSPAGRIDVVVYVQTDAIMGGRPALTTGTGWVAGSTITIINNGYIEGAGGNGNGFAGGNAIELSWSVTIDNANGFIRGGGGGGGVGGADPGTAGGGFGGGGQGNPGGTAGGYGATAGTRSMYGIGGAGHHDVMIPWFCGGMGGSGGDWGRDGQAGSPSYYAYNSGLPGGAAGYAIKLNGNAVTWLGGYDGYRVVGAVV